MFDWVKSLWAPKKPFVSAFNQAWEDLCPGDFVRLYLKDPKTVGIISTTESLTYQRLDSEDLAKLTVDGFVVGKQHQGRHPYAIDLLELNVVKKRGNQTRLVSYLLLKEEISKIKHIEGENE